MCGRFTLVKIEEFIKALPWVSPLDAPPPPRYNIAPSQDILVVPNTAGHKLQPFHWGLIPAWAKDPSIGNRMINARAETLAEKPAFRAALKRRRCLIPADGFYEWRKNPDGKTKTPMYIQMKSGRPFAFAGLWDTWHDEGESELHSCTIITTQPNALVAPIHDRMPAILSLEECRKWADPAEESTNELLSLLHPYGAEEMTAHPVSKVVNSPATDSAECIKGVEADGLFA